MYKLLSANGTDLLDPEGSYQLSKNDIVNEYEGENGRKTIEIVRQNVISGSVSYKGLTASMLKKIMDSLSLVTNFVLYDPSKEALVEIEARVSNIKANKIYHRDNISFWSLSFNIDEL